VAGGNIESLRSLVNVRGRVDWILLLAWLTAAMRPSGPYPVLVLHGEQGSAKSTLARLLRALIDPNTAPLRSEPKEPRDLMIAATNSWCMALDNISHLPVWLSDAVCRLSTGGGFATRTLYENDEETIFDAQRPIILNGIEELATRGDLLDRAIILYLPKIEEAERREEKRFWAEFESARPLVLGGFLDAVSLALRNVDQVRLPRLPRMADFAEFATAAEGEMGWPSASFMEAYDDNRDNANEAALEASPVTDAIQSLLGSNPAVEETATELLVKLGGEVSNKTSGRQSDPQTQYKPCARGTTSRKTVPSTANVII